MTTNTDGNKQQNRVMNIVIIYPFVVLLIGIGLNYFVFGVNSYVINSPSEVSVLALIFSAVLLTLNHTWIMTATELTRAKFKIHSTPEEWIKSGANKNNISEVGASELKRHHDTHQNTTENIVYFILLAIALIFVSPPVVTVYVWFVGFAIARIGYTYGFLYGKDGVRGLFMTLSLLAMYGMASYLVISLLV